MKKISLTEILLLGYIVLLPFSLFGPGKFGINIKLCDFIFPFLALSFFVEKRKSIPELLKNGKPLVVFLFFIAACFLSMLNSVDIKKSVLETTSYVYLPFLSLIVLGTIGTGGAFKRFLGTWLITTLVVLCVGFSGFIPFLFKKFLILQQFVQYTDLEKSFECFPRLKATFFTPNMLLTYLHVGLVLTGFCLYGTVTKDPIKKWKASSLSGFILFIFAGMFFTMSRRLSGALLSAVLALKRFSNNKLLKLLKVSLAIVFIVFFGLSVLTTVWQVSPLKSVMSEDQKIQIPFNTTLSMHALPQVVSVRMLRKNPLIGVGIGTYREVFSEFYTTDEVLKNYDIKTPGFIESESIKDKTYRQDPHSMYLGSLAELGILGFLSLMLFFVYLYRFIFRKIKELGSKEKNAVFIFLAGISGFLFNGLMTDILTMRHFWILIGISLAFISICRNNQIKEGESAI